jgi:hypothetical protein
VWRSLDLDHVRFSKHVQTVQALEFLVFFLTARHGDHTPQGDYDRLYARPLLELVFATKACVNRVSAIAPLSSGLVGRAREHRGLIPASWLRPTPPLLLQNGRQG